MLWPSMSIAFQPNAGVFTAQRIHVHHVMHPAVNLQAVLVDDGAKIVELVMRGRHHRFPNAALLLLAIAHDAKGMEGLFSPLCRQRATHRDAQSLSKRTTGNLNSGQLQAVGMAFESGSQLAEHDSVFQGEVAGATE